MVRLHRSQVLKAFEYLRATQYILNNRSGVRYLNQLLLSNTHCRAADVKDIGESSYSMVLTDDLDNNNRMDLLVSTMNGHVFVFETPAEYHPLKVWTKQPEGNAGFTARHDWVRVMVYAV